MTHQCTRYYQIELEVHRSSSKTFLTHNDDISTLEARQDRSTDIVKKLIWLESLFYCSINAFTTDLKDIL